MSDLTIMVVVEVYSESIKIKYKSTFLSKATVFSVISSIVSILVPYFIAVQTEGFWQREHVFHEQPKVNMRGEYFFTAVTDNQSHPIVCTTFPIYKEHSRHLDNCALFKLREIDNNDDGKSDQLDFSVRINLYNLCVTSLILILPINYELKTICPLKMQSGIILQYYFNQKNVTDLTVMADLAFNQMSALPCDKEHYNYYDSPLMGSGEEESEFQFGNIIENYFKRNLTTHLINVYTLTKSEKDIFNLKLSIRYPEHKIYYLPGFWYKMKMAWIQYLAIFVIVTWICDKIKGYMYHTKWLLFYEESPMKKEL